MFNETNKPNPSPKKKKGKNKKKKRKEKEKKNLEKKECCKFVKMPKNKK